MKHSEWLRPAAAVLVAAVGYVGIEERPTLPVVVEASSNSVELGERVKGELIISSPEGYEVKLDPQILEKIVTRGLPSRMVRRDGAGVQVQRVEFDDSVSEEQMQREYAKVGVLAEYNYRLKTAEVDPIVEPNDPAYPEQKWYLEMINVEQAWKLADGQGVRVEVVDTGVEEVIDLKGRLKSAYGPEGEMEKPVDIYGHGTFVAGEIAAIIGNGYGVVGISKSDLTSSRMYWQKNGGLYGTLYELRSAIMEASFNRDVDVINVSSTAMTPCPTYLQDTIDLAGDRGTLVVASAGNSDMSLSLVAPANCRGVIPVVAVNKTAERTSWSNWATGDDAMAAPGERIVGLNREAGFLEPRVIQMSGTSMAAPMVAGGATLVKSVKPELSAHALRTLLYQTGQVSDDSKRGRLLDVAKAVTVAKLFFREWFVPAVSK